MTVPEKLTALRQEMKKEGISAWIIPSSDPHNTEYTPARWHGREWFSGFTGSAGTVVVTLDSAGLWADGRYHIQAPQQMAGTGIDVFKQGLPEVPTISAWLSSVLPKGAVIGFDGAVLSKAIVDNFQKDFVPSGLALNTGLDLLDRIWADRAEFPAAPIWEHKPEFSGRTSSDKIADLRQRIAAKYTDALVVSALDDVAWLFNYRGSDVNYIPVAMAFGVVTESEAIIFIDEAKVSEDQLAVWQKEGVERRDYNEITTYFSEISGKKVLVDPSSLNWNLVQNLKDNAVELVEGRNPVTDMKAVKNKVELTNYRKCHARDGAAVVRFMKWLEEEVPKGGLHEHEAAIKLESFRQMDDSFIEPSFTTIPGYGVNGALMHYSSSPEKPVELGLDNFFLVDSGGQYPDGTTDITRTFSYGDVSDRMRKDYTLVAKAVISLTRAKFMKGASPIHLDVISRGILWQEGINYGCGTGHGVGICLKVHEAPHNFGVAYTQAPFEPGVVITNEPGVYREGVHGVRIENIMEVVEDEVNEFGTFYRFDTLTLAPICTRALDLTLLGDENRQWLNDYHEKVYKEVSPLLNDEEKSWLKQATVSV